MNRENKTDNVSAFRKITEEMAELYEMKNADYADSFSQTYADYGIKPTLARMEDKLRRVKNIVLNGMIKVKSESIEDTLIDLACYAIMTLIEVRKRRINRENKKKILAEERIVDNHETSEKAPESEHQPIGFQVHKKPSFALPLEGNCITCIHACREAPYRCELRNKGEKCKWSIKDSYNQSGEKTK